MNMCVKLSSTCGSHLDMDLVCRWGLFRASRPHILWWCCRWPCKPPAFAESLRRRSPNTATHQPQTHINTCCFHHCALLWSMFTIIVFLLYVSRSPKWWCDVISFLVTLNFSYIVTFLEHLSCHDVCELLSSLLMYYIVPSVLHNRLSKIGSGN